MRFFETLTSRCRIFRGKGNLKQTLSIFIYKSSTDIDECSETPNICPNGKCQNFRAGYQCTCNTGYRESGDMKQCIGGLTNYISR